MQPGALNYLADCFEARSPGFAFQLRSWELVLPHDPIAVAREALRLLADTQRLIERAPEDPVIRDERDAVTVVFHEAARRVFARDATARSPHV